MRYTARTLVMLVCIPALITSAGCITRLGYGRITPAPENKSIEDFVDNWRDYHVSYAGLHPGQPSGLMFDPRYDEQELRGKRWRPVHDRETLEEIVMWLRQNDTYPPELLRIIGPEQVVYGYVYTGWNQVVARAVDTQAMYVLDLPSPLPEEGYSSNQYRHGGP